MFDDFEKVPVLVLKTTVVFPNTNAVFEIKDKKQLLAFKKAELNGNIIFVVYENERNKDINSLIGAIGTFSLIIQSVRINERIVNIKVEGKKRGIIKNIINSDGFIYAEIKSLEDTKFIDDNKQANALIRLVKEEFEKYSAVSGKMSPDIIMDIISAEDLVYLLNAVSAGVPFELKNKQEMLEKNDIFEKGKYLAECLLYETELSKIQKEIRDSVNIKINKNQREFYLKQQIKAIQDELGVKDRFEEEINLYKNRLETGFYPENVIKRAEKEIERLSRIPPSSAESVIATDYIELLLNIPWNNSSNENKNIKEAKVILEKEHYGLSDVKERIIEFIAARQNSNKLDAPVLCFLGPSGVGKTSITKSIAKALNRKYVSISLGGISDDAEIRGHRRTYVGAMTGRIINAVKIANTNNPIILLDEIDKMGKTYKGEPAAALLELFDSEQNKEFRDHYLEIPFDMSNVLFICTANSFDGILPSLRDRLEVISIGGYTDEEKIVIAQKFIIPKQIEKYGLKKENIKINRKTIEYIIKYYTREAGVRQLEGFIEKICRKAVKSVLTEGEEKFIINIKNISKYLGKRLFMEYEFEKKDLIGVVHGLAWTAAGGIVLNIETNVMKGKGNVIITGNTGNIMNESAMAAISYIRANCKSFCINENFYDETDIHIHIPKYSILKDGPSAGTAIACSVISALTGKKIKRDIAMTGEITLKGLVLAVGGIKEKVLAALRVGIKKIIISKLNKEDINELPDYVLKEIEIIYAENMIDVIKNAVV